MSFALSKNISPTKVFLVCSSKLEQRWDPNYYRWMKVFRARVKNSQYPIERLKPSLALVQYGISERATGEPVGVPMLRMINLQSDTWHISDMKYIAMSDDEKKPYLLRQNDILFNRTNSKELVGKCCVFNLPGEYVFASYLIRVRLKQSELLPDYVTAYLASSLGRIQIDAVSRQIAGMTNINAEEIRDLLIPVPSRAVQERVAASWQEAIVRRDEMLASARSLLRRVDNMVLEELGINLTVTSPISIKARIFTTSLREVSGGRLDPEMVLFLRTERSCKYPTRRLAEFFSEPPQYGAGERGLDRETRQEPRYIRITDIDEFGRLSRDVGATATTVEKRYILRDGDLLVARSGNTVGKAYLHNAELQPYVCFYAGYLIRLRFDPARIEPEFVFAITQSSYYKTWVSAVQRSAGQPNINAEEYSGFQIPVPPKTVQRAIVTKMQSVRAEAEELQQRAFAEFEKAKKAIEALILGQEGSVA